MKITLTLCIPMQEFMASGILFEKATNSDMKNIFTLTLALSLCCSALAQGKHETAVFIGGYKAEFTQADLGDNYAGFSFASSDRKNAGDLFDLYEPHYSYVSGPVLTVSYNYILNKWVRFGAQANFGSVSGQSWYEIGDSTASYYHEQMLSVLPQVKVCIPSPKHFRLYGKAAAGLQYTFGSLRPGGKPLNFAWDIVPIGAEWGGQRIYGCAELCWGSIIRGGRIGLGFRF